MGLATAPDPIFVRGLSRSGGTLMVTVLDAHPDVAMSYELYPSLLELGGEATAAAVAEQVALMDVSAGQQFAREVSDKKLRTFAVRMRRGGMTPEDVVDIFAVHLSEQGGFETVESRIGFVARCCAWKADRFESSRWGAKALIKDYQSVLEAHPEAVYVNVVRDGRDVLASQLNTGDFKASADKVAKSWSNNHLKFRRLMQRHPDNFVEVIYEDFVTNPDEAIAALGARLHLSPSVSMARYYDEDLTLYQSSHLSLERVSKKPDVASIGRWQRDLDRDQLAIFESVAGEAMATFGYLPAASQVA